MLCKWLIDTDVSEYHSAVEMSVNSLPPDMAKVPKDLSIYFGSLYKVLLKAIHGLLFKNKIVNAFVL
jgi:hypothetical protein